MSTTFILLSISLLISWGVSLLLIRFAPSLKLVQAPNHRSSHTHPTPTGGGIGMVLGTTLTGLYLAFGNHSPHLEIILGLALILAVVGLVDDIRHVSARLRFSLHIIICAITLLLFSPLISLHLVNHILFANLLAFIFLLFAGTWWINLFNFMDGLDGLAGTQALMMILISAALSLAHAGALNSPMWILMLCTAASVVGFLLLNWAPAKIFMGDAGSTWLAFIIFAFGLFTMKAGWLNISAWLILGAPFITDATVTLLIRMKAGERWYEAHRNHAFQKLSRHWQSDRKSIHRSVTLSFAVINVLLVPLAWACLYSPKWSLVWLAIAYIPLLGAAFFLGAGKPTVC